MNAEQGGANPGQNGSPLEHTGSAEAKGTNQSPEGTPTGDSFSKITSETQKDESDSSKIERVRQEIFDSKGNFVLTPATAGGIGLENEDPKSSRVLKAQIPSRRAGKSGHTGSAGATGGRNPLGGIRGRIVAAVTALGLVLGGGATYVANQQADSGGENNPGGVPTQPVGETPKPVATSTPEPTDQPATPTAETVEPTNTPEPIATLTPEAPSSLSQYPEKIVDAKTYGKVTIARTQESIDRITCGDGTCVPMKKPLLNVEDYPDAEQRLNDGVDYGFYLAWLAKNNITKGDYSFESYKNDLQNTDKDLSFILKADVGTKVRNINEVPIVEDVVIDPRNPVSIVWVSEAYPYMKYVGGNNISGGVSLGYRVINNELIIEIFDGNGGGVDRLVSGIIPAEFQGGAHLSAALGILSEPTIQESSSKNFPVTLSPALIEKINDVKSKITPQERNSIIHTK